MYLTGVPSIVSLFTRKTHLSVVIPLYVTQTWFDKIKSLQHFNSVTKENLCVPDVKMCIMLHLMLGYP